MNREDWNERRATRLGRKILGIKMRNLAAENAGKPANSVNEVTFSELMRQLRGES